MVKVLSFRVGIKGLDDKIWRKVEIKESDSLADLVCFILSSFELFSNEFFSVTYNKYAYDSAHYLFNNDDYKSVMSIILKDIDFETNKNMTLNYDLKNKIAFIIDYIESKEVKEDDYPKIIDGAGKGALDYVSGEELKQIIEETDKLGYSNYSTTIEVDGKDEEEIFDYKDFDLEINNFLSS